MAVLAHVFARHWSRTVINTLYANMLNMNQLLKEYLTTTASSIATLRHQRIPLARYQDIEKFGCQAKMPDQRKKATAGLGLGQRALVASNKGTHTQTDFGWVLLLPPPAPDPDPMKIHNFRPPPHPQNIGLKPSLAILMLWRCHSTTR